VSEWATAVLVVLGMLAVAVAIITVQVKNPCDCRRSRLPYFAIWHERGWAMLLWVYWLIPFTVLAFVNLNWFSAPINMLLIAWHLRRWWFHEKEKMKKKAAKLAGRVGLNSHGRLVVESG
jgi:hypothetical protein